MIASARHRVVGALIAIGVGAALSACSGLTQSDGATSPPDAGAGFPGAGSGDACAVGLTSLPVFPVAGATTIAVTAHVMNMPGVPSYQWAVRFANQPVVVSAQGDGSVIDFVAAQSGIYDVSVNVPACAAASQPINVQAPGARQQSFRFRVATSDGSAPTQEQDISVLGGAAADLGTLSVDAGMPAQVTVSGPTGGVAAYLQFTPDGMSDSSIDGFAGASGALTLRLTRAPTSVLVIPSSASLAPRRFTGWLAAAASPLIVDAGVAVSGSVVDPAGAALAGAIVELIVDGVPSTVATTANDGSFSLRAAASGNSVAVSVVPPAGSGLPRLSASSTAFDLTMPVRVRYLANLTRRSLAGVRVQRPSGAALANAQVLVVGGMLAGGLPLAAGSVTAGVQVSASGQVQIAATADSTGALPAVMIPAAQLSAVVVAAPGDLAVVAFDATTAVPASLSAPAMQPIATAAVSPDGASGLGGAVLDIVPVGELAMAAASPIHLTADASGAFAAELAAGGTYDLRFRDPAGRAAARIVHQIAPPQIELAYPLAAAVRLRGVVRLSNQLLPGASIQVLRDDDLGPDPVPLAEVVSDAVGGFTVAVPDPGTM